MVRSPAFRSTSGQPPVNRVVYPDPTNKKRLTTTVRVTLKRTLTTNQKRHPLPIASRGSSVQQVTTEGQSSSQRGPLPRPLPGSPRPSFVLRGVAVAAHPPTTKDRPRCPCSKTCVLRSSPRCTLQTLRYLDTQKGQDPKTPALPSSL